MSPLAVLEMGLLDRFRGDKVAQYIDRLRSADRKGREEAAKKLCEHGDGRAIEPLLEYAKWSKNPVSVEALANIGGEEAVRALSELYYRDRYHIRSRPWLTHVEQSLIKLGHYESCREIMLSKSPNSHSAAEVVVKNPKWRKDKDVILKFVKTFYVPPVITLQELLDEMDPEIRRDKEIILSLITKHGCIEPLQKYLSVDEMIDAIKDGIEKINNDQEYYLREQTPGAPENYDWDKARKPLHDLLEHLEKSKKGKAN